jgi:hypothetical protein
MIRTVTVNYPGLEPLEVQIATGEKGVKVNEIIKKFGDKETDNMKHGAEIVALCTKYTTEEVVETFTVYEIMDLVFIVQGDLETIKKVNAIVNNISN